MAATDRSRGTLRSLVSSGKAARRPRRERGHRRRSTGWFGTYRLVVPAERDWQSCVIQDLSLGGAGIDIQEACLAIGDVVELDVYVRTTASRG
jgi:hypothetical protein